MTTSPEVLRAAHKDLVAERDRLRDARASFTSRLGPLPPSAAIAISLTGSVVEDVSVIWLAVATALLGVMVLISALYSGLKPYRLLRGEKQSGLEKQRNVALSNGDTSQLGFGLAAQDEVAWLQAKIKLEQSLYGGLRKDPRFLLSRKVGDLQQGLDVERSAFNVVQFLFVAIIVVLVLGVALRDESFVAWIVVGSTLLALGIARYLGRPRGDAREDIAASQPGTSRN
jgi:hypothetical protein